ncbi:UPF0450 protein C17orf58 homolog isoform X1 [Mixophyes fleayi]|uniref:UPF0450 protein C17orf58 homolog isoform X1 n=1 Tax=Mixophyes fleayi TaxID=3061075 RepID=UPI003F4DFCB8
MISGAVCTLVLSIAVATISAAKKDVWQNSSFSLEMSPSGGTFREVVDLPWSMSLNRYTSHGLLAATRPLRLGDRKTMVLPDKRIKTKVSLDNITGLRKTNGHHGNRLPTNVLMERSATNEYGNSHELLQGRVHQEPGLVPSHFHSAKTSSIQGEKDTEANMYGLMDHESNRPGKITPKKPIDVSHNSSKAAWITNRHPSSILYQFHAFRKESDSKERICLSECYKERDEREAYCNSDFAVNGIIHDVDTLSKGTQLLTVLVNSGGLYKMNRLYITPDGFFFRVKILAVDNLNCHKSCLDFKLGSRYIIMGQIYHKRMELPMSMQQIISGRLRAGDGLVMSGSNFVRRFNRKKERKLLAAMHSKCK